MDNIFEQASRQKLRFSASRGTVSTEDLWDLALEELDTIARGLNKKVKDSSEESFIKKQAKADKRLSLSLEVVVSVINTKLAEEEKRKKSAERKIKQDKILAVLAEKQDSALQKKSIASLQAELDKLYADEEEE